MWQYGVVVVVCDDVCAMVYGRVALCCYAGFYVLSGGVVALYDALYACFVIGFDEPYMLKCVIHVCLVQDGALDKYDGRLLLLYPLCVVVAYGGVYYIVEDGELLWVAEYYLCEVCTVYLSIGLYYFFSPLGHECLSQGRGVHEGFGLCVGVIYGILHDAQYL